MLSKATTVEEYIESLPDDRKEAVIKLRNIIRKNIPKGFKEVMSYGMIGYVVPHSIYAEGYHCDPKLPLPFINIASQKNFISIHHMGIYSDPALYKWFTTEYSKISKTKLDIGKACIRFKKPESIPYELLAELVSKISVQDYVNYYDSIIKSRNLKKKK